MEYKIAGQRLSGEQLRSVNHLLPAEYLLVFSPHQELWNQVTRIKAKFSSDYEHKIAALTHPHITLVSFVQYQSYEPRLLPAFRAIAKTIRPFKVELKNFGSFPSHTIYINIVSKVPIVQAVKAFRGPQQYMKLDKEHKPHFITEPHLTIARKLLPWQYEKAWLEYQQLDFHGRFIADKAVLLRRKPGERYQTVEEFYFEGIAAPEQGQLF